MYSTNVECNDIVSRSITHALTPNVLLARHLLQHFYQLQPKGVATPTATHVLLLAIDRLPNVQNELLHQVSVVMRMCWYGEILLHTFDAMLRAYLRAS